MAGNLGRRHRMSPVDTAWLRMDSPGNLMMIVGVDVFDGEADVPRLRGLLETQLLRWPQFRSRAVVDATGSWWEEVEQVDLDHHLVRIGLPGAGDKAELQRLVGHLASQSLDATKPLWQFHVVERYAGGHALIVRIHHCIADGIALIGVMMALARTSADEPDPPHRRERHTSRSDAAGWLGPFTSVAVDAIEAAGDWTARALQGLNAALEDPDLASKTAGGFMRALAQGSQDLAGIALMDNDTVTPLKGRPGGSKAVAWSDPVPLADVKAVGRAIGCSVNDVLLSSVAGALADYLRTLDVPLDGAELRAMVPVNLRGDGPPTSLGNRFGLVPLLLPVGIADPIARVLEVRARMNALKGSYTAVLAMTILGATGVAPRAVQKQALDLLARKATAVMTNVPGPQHALYMAGSRLRQMMFWVPQSGDIGVGVSILSYDGGVQFGVVTDRRMCEEPQRIIDRFAPAFETLVHAVLLQPWDDAADPVMAERSLDATEALATAATHLAERKAPSGADGQEAAGTAAAAAGAATVPLGEIAAADGAAVEGSGNGITPPAGLRKRRRSAFAAARGG